MNPLISIIVPVYNAEKTLKVCVNSIINQTYTNWELLLIDDGSSDDSKSLCDEYAIKDYRIKVLHKDNGGVSSARNLGLDNAKGEWVTFVDSDDNLIPKALDINWEEAKEDLIIFSYCIKNKNRIEKVNLSTTQLNSKEQLKYFYENNVYKQILKVPWSKLYRTKKIGRLRFDTNIRVGEDFLFNLQFLLKIQSCKLYSKVFYMYNENEVFFYKKYQMSVNDSIYVMSRLFYAYRLLNIKSSNFERWLFLDYRNLCIDDIYKNPVLWYKNYKVKVIYNYVKPVLGLEYKLKYKLLSIPLVSYLNNKLKWYH